MLRNHRQRILSLWSFNLRWLDPCNIALCHFKCRAGNSTLCQVVSREGFIHDYLLVHCIYISSGIHKNTIYMVENIYFRVDIN